VQRYKLHLQRRAGTGYLETIWFRRKQMFKWLQRLKQKNAPPPRQEAVEFGQASRVGEGAKRLGLSGPAKPDDLAHIVGLESEQPPYFIARGSAGGMSMRMHIDTIAEAKTYALMALDDDDYVMLESTSTGERWEGRDILNLPD
jgi:hypothetical protein